ncbi:Os10g0358150, partial [Oryza sativa Japonica Group]
VLPPSTFDRYISKSEKFIFDRHISIQQLIILMTFSNLMRDSPFFHTRLATWALKNVNINESLVYEE